MMKMNTANNPKEAIELINYCEEIIRTQHKPVIQYICKQGEILKMFIETVNFFDGLEQSRLTLTTTSTLPASSFCNNLKCIKL